MDRVPMRRCPLPLFLTLPLLPLTPGPPLRLSPGVSITDDIDLMVGAGLPVSPKSPSLAPAISVASLLGQCFSTADLLWCRTSGTAKLEGSSLVGQLELPLLLPNESS